MPSTNKRPHRLTVRDELDRPRTLAPGRFDCRGQGPRLLVLGLGPSPEEVPVPSGTGQVFYLECSVLKDQMPPGWHASIPPTWIPVLPDELSDSFLREVRVCTHSQGPLLFPSFWNPVLARLELARFGATQNKQLATVLLAGSGQDLLVPEIRAALEGLGFQVTLLQEETTTAQLADLLRNIRPSLFLSVNFKGCDPYGRNVALFKTAGVPAAVWCVDNPFHLISRVQGPFWRDLTLFVTDDWFLEPLREHGGGAVHHLPLATSPALFAPRNPKAFADLADRTVFVGRSAFPGKERFFAASRVQSGDLRAALTALGTGQRPDFSWWLDRLGTSPLWPGTQVRHAGLGAETTSRQLRIDCVARAAAASGTTVFGDAGWHDLLPQGTDCRPQVDYYGPLADIYATSGTTLNVTSLLLPRGLTQRHFDVWSAGGFLISDATPGLKLFPRELTALISFSKSSDIPALLSRLNRDHQLRHDLARTWQTLIHSEHTYKRRLERLLNTLEISTPRRQGQPTP